MQIYWAPIVYLGCANLLDKERNDSFFLEAPRHICVGLWAWLQWGGPVEYEAGDPSREKVKAGTSVFVWTRCWGHPWAGWLTVTRVVAGQIFSLDIWWTVVHSWYPLWRLNSLLSILNVTPGELGKVEEEVRLWTGSCGSVGVCLAGNKLGRKSRELWIKAFFWDNVGLVPEHSKSE